MSARDEIRDRLTTLRQRRDACDYYDPRSKLLDGKIDALEWVLAEMESAESVPNEKERRTDNAGEERC
ncbi:hypothetical protein C482_08913 [Natrialba chahannaoensis JCM 10990]|uniref:Uncharacterized protein n=1 Tax=Natrialba chahannaoensis JCM 10990 TaxID=1227492 RepID=M0ANT2_9EURY|nr:hypothetical protein [Natrialba chahannaoensis]ELZ00195.1 hypothetical protein C482_08913 [Natrialba chahannaoensis JCM 10990]